MSVLREKGPEALANWTAVKNVNIFDKKMLFIPVHANVHWSLLVVVNSGLIANSLNRDISDDKEHSCILFLDSLKMHDSETCAKDIRIWLNFEWKRHGRGEDTAFTKETIPVLSPTGM